MPLVPPTGGWRGCQRVCIVDVLQRSVRTGTLTEHCYQSRPKLIELCIARSNGLKGYHGACAVLWRT